MKSSFFACCWLLLATIPKVHSQDPGVMLYEESLITESVSFRLPDSIESERYTEQDWVMLSANEEVRRETRTIHKDGSEDYSILIQESSQAKEWEHIPLQIISDEDGLNLFNGDGLLLESIPHSDLYRGLQDSLEQFRVEEGIPVMTHLPYLEDLDQEMLQSAGVVVTGDSKHFQIKSVSGEVEVNHKYRYLKKWRFQREYGIPFYEYTSYAITDQGFLVPKFRKQLQLEQTYSGYCVEKVQTWQQDQLAYYVSPEHALIDVSENGEDVFTHYPNPVIDVLTLEAVTPSSGRTYSVFIYNTLYDLVFQKHGLSYRSAQTLDLTALPSGYYTLRIHHGQKNYSFKIFKQ